MPSHARDPEPSRNIPDGQEAMSEREAGLPLTGERTVPGVEAENYWFRRHEAAYRFAMEYAGGRVLDAGCGEGYGAAMIAAAGGFVAAAELDPPAAAHAAATYGSVRVVRADACRLPFRAGSFDTVVAMQVLEHLWCPEEFVARTREILRPGGSFILSTPNRATFSPQGLRNPFHTHEYTAGELHALLASSYEIVRMRGLRHGVYLRSLDVLAAGSLQHLLMDTAFGEVPPKLRTGVRMTRADHFAIGDAEGSLDLVAIAS
jgi:SAM-dependent methyltransferase